MFKFNNQTNDVQHKMRRAIDKIKKSDEIIINSDKTGHHYSIDVELCHKAINTEEC